MATPSALTSAFAVTSMSAVPAAAYYVAVRGVKQAGPITSVGDISNVVKVDK